MGPGESDQALRHGTIDLLATAARPASDDICFDHVVDEMLVVATPAGRFATATAVSLAELEHERFLVLSYRTASGSRTHLETVRGLCRYVPSVAGQASSLTALLMLVASGTGVALVPSGISRNAAYPGVDFLDLLPSVIVQSGVAWRRGPISPMVTNFLELVAQEAGPESRTDGR
jgi:DNA-binding transcriptional LysR family regulator